MTVKIPMDSLRLAGILFCLSPVAAAVAQTSAPASASAAPSVTESAAAPEEGAYPVVVTGARTPTPLKDVPQRIEIITGADVRQTPAREMTDTLKKNSSVDVKQYPGMLAGIGIRGFSPDLGGLNQHTLMLVNGLPAMTDNPSLLPTQGISRVEVLKGPASALYGSQAMGGVVNVIPRRRTGDLQGGIGLGAGTFNQREIQADMGGSVTPWFNLDYFGSGQKQGDYKTGNGGNALPHGAFRTQNHTLRLGFELNPQWSLDVRGDWYRGRNIQNPGSVDNAYSTPTHKDLDRNSYYATLTGRLQHHTLTAAAFTGTQKDTNYTDPQTADSYLSYKSDTRWSGMQLRDEWKWASWATLVIGLDHMRARTGGVSYSSAGTPSVYSADSQQVSTALYAQQNFDLNNGATSAYVGGRHDWVRLSTLPTDYLAGNQPGSQRFGQFNPSAGIKHFFTPQWAVHASVGKGFVIPGANQLTGYYATAYGSFKGNPSLVPESSVSADIGTSWEGERWNADLTYFSTRVRNKIVYDYANPAYTTYKNADRARMQGLELDARWKLHPSVSLGFGATHFLRAEQETAHVWSDIVGVPQTTVRMALEGKWDRFSGRIGMRYAGKRSNIDWNVYPSVQRKYAGYAVWDLSARYQWARQHSVSLSVDNLFDRYYAEVPGYPMPGRQVRLAYRWDFR